MRSETSGTRGAVAVAALAVASLLAACGQGGTTASTASRTTHKHLKVTKHAYRPPPGALTGFGATDAAWNATHRADPRYLRGSAYDIDPSVTRDGDFRHDDRYYAVTHVNGRITQYSMRFPPNTSVSEGRASVLASEFSSRARTVSFEALDTCALLVVRSPKLSALSPEGEVTIEFTSGEDTMSFSPADVWGAIVAAGRLTEC